MIKAIIFDLGGIFVGDEWRVVYTKIAEALEMPEDQLKEILIPLLKEWEGREINEEMLWKKLEIETGRKLRFQLRKDLFFQTFRENAQDIDESWQILAELRDRGVRLALLSNTNPAHLRALKETGRIDRFSELGVEVFVYSFQVGFRKPDPRIYKLALEELNLPAKDCLFVDDILKNVKATEDLGIKGIHFQAANQLREELGRAGLL